MAAIGSRVYVTHPSEQVVGKRQNLATLVKAGLLPKPRSSMNVNERNGSGNAIEWTAEKSGMVFNMLKWGIPIEDVAIAMHCSVPTLRKYCKPHIEQARVHANCRVAEVFFKMAVSGKVPAATMQWMKARVPGFKDTINHTGEIAHVHAGSAVIDPKKLTTEQLKAIEAAYAAGAADVIDATAESV